MAKPLARAFVNVLATPLSFLGAWALTGWLDDQGFGVSAKAVVWICCFLTIGGLWLTGESGHKMRRQLYDWRQARPILTFIAASIVGAIVAPLLWWLVTLRPPAQAAAHTNALAPPATALSDPSTYAKHSLELGMLQDRTVIKHNGSVDAVTIEFRLLNTTFPQAEVHNVFGSIWVDSAFVLSSTLPPSSMSTDRTEWDVQIPVFPKQASFTPTSIRIRMPGPNDRVTIGAQFVSKETNKRDYLWNVTSEGGLPKTVIIRK